MRLGFTGGGGQGTGLNLTLSNLTLGVAAVEGDDVADWESSNGTSPFTDVLQSEVLHWYFEYGGIHYFVEGVTDYGQYVDGTTWVTVTSGTLSEYSPAKTTNGGDNVNGVMLNPQRGIAQGWDERLDSYSSGLNESLPVTIVVDDILIFSSHEADISAGNRDGVTDEYTPLFVVSSAPASNSMPPAVAGWSGRSTFTEHVFDVDTVVAALPAYSATSVDNPTFTELMDHLDKYNPIVGMTHQASGDGYEVLFPHLFGDNTGTPHNYGQYVARTIGAGMMALLLDAYTTPQKREIALRICQIGLNAYDSLIGDSATIGADGGHHQYLLGPICAYLTWTGQTAALATLKDDIGTNCLEQPFQIDASFIAAAVPHDSATGPCTWRRRTIPAGGVTGLDITFPVFYNGTNSDNFRLRIIGMKIVRESDSAEATITAMPNGFVTKEETNLVATIDAQPGTDFAAGDVIYFESLYSLVDGNYDWGVRTVSRPSWYVPNSGADYRGTNFWTPPYLFLQHLGVSDSDFDAFYGYVEAANSGSFPAEDPFPNHHDTFNSDAFAETMWDEHKETIAPTASFPVIESFASSVTETASTSHTVNMPSGITSGDFLVMCYRGAIDNINTPSGWSAFAHVGNTMLLLYKVATGSEGATLAVTSPGTTKATFVTMRVSNQSGLSGVEKNESSDENGPLLTPSWGSKKTLWLSFYSCRRSDQTITIPSGYTFVDDAVNVSTPTSGNSCQLVVGQLENEATSENPGVHTIVGTISNDRTFTIGIEPA
ncbi:MAG: hypothetical protein COA96_15605 [SAR86 cluster bacterium]|uniref:Uncharacterized protein n=1 Tax=SAR86 cluster bacterium TaxID=2030880 RepID=A0A2A5AP18_9GAMM|nr:MAG: hypothetical protein COA96_15605 [SAR86 cluster bacterium]